MQAGEKERKVGLLGGTFDPIHFGHLFIAEEARVACGLEEVIFFPNGQPAHVEGKMATLDGESRLDLLERAIAPNPHFCASRIELERPGKSYAFDTLHEFRRRLGFHTELFFIMGADSMLDIMTWYRGPELFELCRFVVASRPGFDMDLARAALTEQQNERVTWLEVPGLHIASRDLRERLRQGRPIRYLIPDSVLSRMGELGLYKV
ncbi:nicotinate-nucleotide adenylyltransferase [bacterium]|nr:MAG: nicotinate-nucleotide adenylyltransferase [bacterium]